MLEIAQELIHQGQQNGSSGDSRSAPHAAENNHHDDIHRLQKIKAFGRDVADEVGIEAPGQTGEEGPDDESRDLVFCGVDPHGLGGDFVVAHGDEPAPIGRVDQTRHNIDGHCGDTEGPEQIRVGWNALEAACTTECIRVLNDNADDFSKPKGDDGEVVATKPKGWHANEEAAEGGKETACEQGCKKGGLGLPSGC